ncbi:MAG: hypothetical protein PHP46_02345 [Candidatus Omnitrophica bacterium]|nr:hypothetical protein [Candidatus Omnitrophota bacterium]
MRRDRVCRVIDANLNRSREGLRVCEEIARFILNSPRLTKELKSIRHGISNTMKGLPVGIETLCRSRDSRADIGGRPKFEINLTRKDCLDIFAANIERAKESLRALEEFSRLLDSASAARFLKLRFKVYDIEKRSVKKISTLHNIRYRNSAG